MQLHCHDEPLGSVRGGAKIPLAQAPRIGGIMLETPFAGPHFPGE
jgi:hypothetical protein